MALSFNGPSGNQPKVREPLRDYLDAVNDQLAVRESVGAGATPYLLQQKAELEAALGIGQPVAAPEPEFERKDAEPAPENVVPRRPGRPKKDVSDAAASSV